MRSHLVRTGHSLFLTIYVYPVLDESCIGHCLCLMSDIDRSMPLGRTISRFIYKIAVVVEGESLASPRIRAGENVIPNAECGKKTPEVRDKESKGDSQVGVQRARTSKNYTNFRILWEGIEKGFWQLALGSLIKNESSPGTD